MMGSIIAIDVLLEQEKDATREVLVKSYEQYKDSYENEEVWNTYIGEIRTS
jgi:hypothetical protein